MSLTILQSPEIAEWHGESYIFLAGPIQGAADWQAEAVQIFQKMELDDKVVVANPRRAWVFPPGSEEFERQVEWEWQMLTRSQVNGVTMFWLAKEAEHDCARAYAQTTRLELGWLLSWERENWAQVVVGIEDGFPGAKYIRKMIKHMNPGMVICDTLEQTCKTAAELL